MEVLQKVKPKLFILENVTGILSAKNPDGTKVIENLVEAFQNIGYSTSIFKLNAADFGVPQRRVRVFIIGTQKESLILEPIKTHTPENWVSAYEALSDLSDTSDSGIGEYTKKPQGEFQKLMRIGQNGKFDLHFTPYASKKDQELINHIPPGGNYMDVPDEIATKRILNFKKTGGRTTTYGRLSKNSTSYTLNTHFNRLNVGCNIHYEKERLISLREGLRIQSFPDSFEVFSKNKRNFYVQIGNAVPPILAKAWADHLWKYI